MKRLTGLILFLTCLFYWSCSDDDSNPVVNQEKSYEVKYLISGSVTVDQLKYLTHSGDTLSITNVAPG